MKERIIDVRWVDSGTGGGWQFLTHLDAAPCECRTVGFLLHENKDSITVSSSLSFGTDGKPNQAADPITIPKVAVKSRRFVKVPR